MSGRITIAVDGPAASGKGTIARAIAAKYGLAHLDTGALYRAVGYLAGLHPGDLLDEGAAIKAVALITPALLNDPVLRTAEAGAAASRVAALPAVRSALLAFQQDFARHPPEGQGGAVLDGRDIGTVICPGADVKIYVTARPEVRARRRWLELVGAGRPITEDEVLADIRERDERDSQRASAPLRAADDAHLLDTSDLSIEAAFAAACAIIEDTLNRGAVRGA